MKNNNFMITVKPQYLAEHSDPEAERFIFAYTVKILNTGNVTAQLQSRHWVITDAEGQVQEVRGPGVIGQQPTLKPGSSFEYTSTCPLRTAVGTMHGAYQWRAEDGTEFEVEIPPFVLAMPRVLH